MVAARCLLSLGALPDAPLASSNRQIIEDEEEGGEGEDAGAVAAAGLQVEGVQPVTSAA